MADNPLIWYNVEDCYLCNSTGIIFIPSKYPGESEETECPVCNGRGSLKKVPKKLDKPD